MKIAYISGKIETRNRDCFVGNQKVDCPGSQTKTYTQTGDKLDLLPQIPSLEKRSDTLFFTFLLVIILGFGALAVFKVKIFGKTLGEYVKPIWYLILIAILTVFWQYLFGLKIDDNLMSLKISQWIWEAMVLVSVYKLSKIPDFGYKNMFFLGILYSFFIHGLKVSIRYFFYGKSFLYVADRFLYGSLLVMIIAFILGSVFVYLRRKGLRF